MDKPFKILSIDGGGIKGLYSSKIIEHLEEKHQCSMSDYFDMICGTSTGGLIALALSLKIPATEISKIYETYGENIFPKRNKYYNLFRQTLFRGKYSDKNLRKVLELYFGDKKIIESNNLLCIPSYSITDGRPFVFKFDHKEGSLDRDNKAKYVDIALATSAAPTYFPLSEIDYYNNKQFIDGGVWANNPTLVGVIEALTYFLIPGSEYTSLEILSISSLNATPGKPTGLKRNRSFIDWKDDLFDTSINGSSFFTHYILSKLSEVNNTRIKYIRVPSEQISAEQSHLIQLDNASKNAIDLIKGKGNDRGEIVRKDEKIQELFKNKKTYKTR